MLGLTGKDLKETQLPCKSCRPPRRLGPSEGLHLPLKNQAPVTTTPKLIVHGGAWNIPDSMDADHLHGVAAAVQTVFPQLLDGMSALDAVEAAVCMLEADPTFDAGRGSFLNELGQVEMDAMIMDGAGLRVGSVAALQHVLHPVSVARLVMERTEHCMLVGEGALRFARSMGVEIVPAEELLTGRELAYYQSIKDDPTFKTHQPFLPSGRDTVGAVAKDMHGNLAAATSTGGTPRKKAGRVGDSPIPGAGAYADNSRGAASATGWGETIMRVLLTKTVCDLFLESGAMAAAEQGIRYLAQRVNGYGGVIGIDAQGHYAWAYNTPKMAFAYADQNGTVRAFIKWKSQ